MGEHVPVMHSSPDMLFASANKSEEVPGPFQVDPRPLSSKLVQETKRRRAVRQCCSRSELGESFNWQDSGCGPQVSSYSKQYTREAVEAQGANIRQAIVKEILFFFLYFH